MQFIDVHRILCFEEDVLLLRLLLLGYSANRGIPVCYVMTIGASEQTVARYPERARVCAAAAE